MEFLKKFSVSSKDNGGVRFGKKFFSLDKAFDDKDLKDVVEYASKSMLPIFTNVQLVYKPTDFFSSGKDDHMIGESEDDAIKVMITLSALVATSGSKLFKVIGGDYPQISLVRPFMLGTSRFEDILKEESPEEVKEVVDLKPNLESVEEAPKEEVKPVEAKVEEEPAKTEVVEEVKEEVKPEVVEEVKEEVKPVEAKVEETPAKTEVKEEVKPVAKAEPAKPVTKK